MDGLKRSRVSNLRIRLLGNLEVGDGSVNYGPPTTRKARSLLAFLLMARGRLHSRDALAGEFWGDTPQERARQSLRTTLWRIRRGLGEGDGRRSLVVTEGEYVGIATYPDVWLDVSEFEARLAASLAPGLSAEAAARSRREAIALYRGPLLEECYDDWCLRERERLRERFVNALERQLHFEEARGDWKAAIRLGEELLHLDPLRETVHRDLMRCHLLAGNRAAALQQYARCERDLARELGIAPMSETTRLHDEIVGRADQPSIDSSASTSRPSESAASRSYRIEATPSPPRHAAPSTHHPSEPSASTPRPPEPRASAPRQPETRSAAGPAPHLALTLERARDLLEQTNTTLAHLHTMTEALKHAQAQLRAQLDAHSVAVTLR